MKSAIVCDDSVSLFLKSDARPCCVGFYCDCQIAVSSAGLHPASFLLNSCIKHPVRQDFSARFEKADKAR